MYYAFDLIQFLHRLISHLMDISDSLARIMFLDRNTETNLYALYITQIEKSQIELVLAKVNIMSKKSFHVINNN